MFRQISQKSVVEAIREQILVLIAEGKLSPGMKLPPEKELIKLLGISRPALREALHRMMGEDILEVRPGSGTFVKEPSSATAIQSEVVSLLLMQEDIMDIQEVRRILEPEIAARVAERASDEEIESLFPIFDEMKELINDNSSIFDLSWSFHRHLAQSVGNMAMTKIIDIIYEMIRVFEKPLYDEFFDPWLELNEHRKLAEVIMKRDPDEARKAMNEHMELTEQRLIQALARKPKMRETVS